MINDEAATGLVSLVTDVGNGELTLNKDGSFSYKPAAGFVGKDRFTYQLIQPRYTSEPITVELSVVSPTKTMMNDDLYETAMDQIVNVSGWDMLESFVGPEADLLSAEVISKPENGEVTLQSDGIIVYRPYAGFVGEDRFRYVISYHVASPSTSDYVVRSEVIPVSIRVHKQFASPTPFQASVVPLVGQLAFLMLAAVMAMFSMFPSWKPFS